MLVPSNTEKDKDSYKQYEDAKKDPKKLKQFMENRMTTEEKISEKNKK